MGNLKRAAILSYLLVFLNSLYGLVLVPYIIGKLGTSEYGVYKTISSFSAALMVLDMGIGQTITRYISKMVAEKKEKEIENYYFMSLLQACLISIVISIIAFIMYQSLDDIYGNSFSSQELKLARILFIILMFNMVISIFENAMAGVIAGFNHFDFTNSMKLMRIVFRICLMVIVLKIYPKAIALILIDVALTIALLLIEGFYIFLKLNIRFQYYYFDVKLFVSSFQYSILMFLQHIIDQIDGNVDNIIIGALVGAAAVTIYSVALQLMQAFTQLSTAISSIMLPTIMNQFINGDSNEELENTIIRVGRYQFIILGAAYMGFCVFGKDFISLWLGDEYELVWIIAMVLMGSSLIPLFENVCISVLRAKNCLVFRTVALACMALINIVVTLWAVPRFGFPYAAVGTALGTILVNTIIMNIYYKKVIGLDVIRILRSIIDKLLICVLICGLFSKIIDNCFLNSWKIFVFRIIVFCVLYFCLLWKYGLNISEKQLIKKFK